MNSLGYTATLMFQDDSNAGLRAQLDDAVAQVKAIVNQPVAAYPKTADAQVGLYSPGWFHPGAVKPDFNHVDVRASQDLQYGRYAYVTSDLTPGLMFKGDECEFNSMTKWAYTDRSLPKKRLTDAEMVEVNRRYRIIGACEEKLARTPQGAVIEGLPVSTGSTAQSDDSWIVYAPYAAGGLLLLLIVLVVVRRRSSNY